MKKILFYILLGFIGIISFPVFSHAAIDCSKSCVIQSEMAPVLKNYLETNKKLIQNISQNLSQTEPTSSFTKVKMINVALNSVWEWTDFFTWVEHLKLELFGEVPTAIKRDFFILEQEADQLTNFLESTINSWHFSTFIKEEDICNGIKNCKISWTAASIIRTMIHNHINVMTYYRLSLTGWEWNHRADILFVPKDFKHDFYNYYNKFTITNCSRCEWEFQNRTTKRMLRIAKWRKYIDKWFDDWREAWALVKWQTSPITKKELQLERKLLQAELSRQWIPSWNGEAILKNLDDFNNTGYSNGNNPINNSFDYFKKSIYSEVKRVWSKSENTRKQILSNFEGLFNSQDPKTVKTIPIHAIASVDYNISSYLNIIKDIDILYQRELPFISNQNLNSDKLQSQIFDLHAELSEAINQLDKTIKFSEKVCNDQDQWEGICQF